MCIYVYIYICIHVYHLAGGAVAEQLRRRSGVVVAHGDWDDEEAALLLCTIV